MRSESLSRIVRKDIKLLLAVIMVGRQGNKACQILCTVVRDSFPLPATSSVRRGGFLLLTIDKEVKIMNKYILLTAVAGVALGSYVAYAGNSATMTVTATIDHDVSLNVTQDLDFGTITINPAYAGNDTRFSISSSGVVMLIGGAITGYFDDIAVGTFTANIANPSACYDQTTSCGGLSLTGNRINNIFGGNDNSNYCIFMMAQDEGNRFLVWPDWCVIQDVSKVTKGTHTHTNALTISYTAP